jgi:putative ABC transport system substrate-binding protein
MRRRDFILCVAAGAITGTRVVQAQPRAPLVGLLNGQSAQGRTHLTMALLDGLREHGYRDGQNIRFEYRWGDGIYDRLPALASELVDLGVDVICTAGGTAAAVAAKAATSTIPIVFITSADEAISFGLIESLSRPGGNMTGVAVIAAELEPKRLDLLHQLVPSASSVAVLLNPSFPRTSFLAGELLTAAALLGIELQIFYAGDGPQIESAFRAINAQGIEALLVGTDPFLFGLRDQIVALTAGYGIPAVYPQREYALDGGLMSYSASLTDAFRNAGIYVARILGGERAAEMPIVQDATFDFVVNLQAANALGLAIPLQLLLLATEVIE